MSRSGYIDDCESDWQTICWSGAVKSAIGGRRGQAFLREMAAALDAMPARRLIYFELESLQGCCALGAVGRARRLDMSEMDPENVKLVAARFGVAPALIREITYWNDEEGTILEKPETRWLRVRAWVGRQIAQKIG